MVTKVIKKLLFLQASAFHLFIEEEETRTQVLELGPQDGSLLWSGLVWSGLFWSYDVLIMN